MSLRLYPVVLGCVLLMAAVSAASDGTFTVVSESPGISGPAGPVIRGNDFVTTISGTSLTGYYLWIRESGSMSGAPGDQPPMILGGQVGVARDPPGGPYTIGNHPVSGGRTIRDDVPPEPEAGTGYYALVTTDAAGSRIVEWSTSSDTDPATYDIRVEGGTGAGAVSDSTEVTVTQGSISISVNGQGVTASPMDESAVAQGDPFVIRGIAAGAPEVAIWNFGTNEFTYGTAPAGSDGTYSYELDRGTTAGLSPGEYIAVIQHPGPDGTFDVYPSADRTEVLQNLPSPGTLLFRISGLSSRQAADALITALNSPNIDDSYTTLSYLVSAPQMSIDPIGVVSEGSILTITGTTTMAAGDHVGVDVYSTAFAPSQKGQGGQYYGTSGTVSVSPGTGGLNTWAFRVDTTPLVPGQYTVLASGIEIPVEDSASFSLVSPPLTPVPTQVSYTPEPSPGTPVPSTTTVPGTTSAPGYGAAMTLAAIAGLLLSMKTRER